MGAVDHGKKSENHKRGKGLAQMSPEKLRKITQGIYEILRGGRGGERRTLKPKKKNPKGPSHGERKENPQDSSAGEKTTSKCRRKKNKKCL